MSNDKSLFIRSRIWLRNIGLLLCMLAILPSLTANAKDQTPPPGQQLTVENADFGDAPASYNGLQNDTYHLITPEYLLGNSLTSEAQWNGVPDSDTGDDGVVFPTMWVGAQDRSLNVTTSVGRTASTPDSYLGRLNVWLDFDQNGTFDADEQIADDVLMTGPYPQALTFSVPGDAVAGTTYARVRFSTQTGLGATGPAYNGEIEDYQITINEPTNVELIRNGSFTDGRNYWTLFGDYVFKATDGEMAFYRTFPGWQGAQIFQNIDTQLPVNARLRMTVSLANASNVPKSVLVRVRDVNWEQSINCSFTIPAQSTLQTATVEGITNVAWSGINVSVHANDNDNLPWVRVDNASLKYLPSEPINGLGCSGFAPTSGVELVQNGDFSNGRFYWILYGDYVFQVVNQVMEFYRTLNGSRLGVLFSYLGQYISPNQRFEASFDVGNSSSTDKHVDLILRDLNWAQIFNCTYVIPANTPLTTLRIRGETSQFWGIPTVMVRDFDDTGSASVRVDNVSLRLLPGLDISTQCIGDPQGASAVLEAGLYEAEQDAIERSGEWLQQPIAMASNGAVVTNNGTEDILSLTFDGSGVAIQYSTLPEGGILVLEVDGVVRRTVSTSHDTAEQRTASITGLTPGIHQLRVYSAENGQLSIDAVTVFE